MVSPQCDCATHALIMPLLASFEGYRLRLKSSESQAEEEEEAGPCVSRSIDAKTAVCGLTTCANEACYLMPLTRKGFDRDVTTGSVSCVGLISICFLGTGLELVVSAGVWSKSLMDVWT